MIQDYFLLLAFFSILQGSFCLNGAIKNVYNLSTINTVEYAASDTPLRLKCATNEVMGNSSFANWIKVWRIDEDEEFDVSQMTFIQANAMIQFSRLTANDSGYYQCCIHGYAYEDFDCYGTQLIVVPGALGAITAAPEKHPTESTVTKKTTELVTEAVKIAKDTVVADAKKSEKPTESVEVAAIGINVTKDSKPEETAAYNVNITYGQQLNAKLGEAYFIRLFYPPAEGMNCTVDGKVNSNIFISNKNFPAELNSDILIPNYNGTKHDGLYECNATLVKGNDTETASAHFTVVSSADSNMHTTKLDPAIAGKYRNRGTSSLAIFSVAILCFLKPILFT